MNSDTKLCDQGEGEKILEFLPILPLFCQKNHHSNFSLETPRKTSKYHLSDYLSNPKMRIWTLMQN